MAKPKYNKLNVLRKTKKEKIKQKRFLKTKLKGSKSKKMLKTNLQKLLVRVSFYGDFNMSLFFSRSVPATYPKFFNVGVSYMDQMVV